MPAETTQLPAEPGPRLGLFFFAAVVDEDATATYDLVLDAVRAADRIPLAFVSTPERHFHAFGGAFPNPSLMSAALAVLTRNVQIRAGSLITPLHRTVRLAEEWAMVDALSGGRAALSVGSGWNVNDFVIAPEEFATRRQRVIEDVAALRAVWATGVWKGTTPSGEEHQVEVHPRPVQRTLPIWTTASRSPDTFAVAGRMGTNVLTHLEVHDLDELAEKIDVYRTAYRRDHDGDGTVTLMMHTYVGDDAGEARRVAVRHLHDYLLTAIDLESRAVGSGGSMSAGRASGRPPQEAAVRRRLAAVGANRYLDGRSLIGDVEECAATARRVRAAGVDEIGCLVDFVPDRRLVVDGVERLGALQQLLAG